MALNDALGTFGPGPTGVVNAQEHRLAIASMITGLSTGTLDVRTGVLPGPNSLNLITGTSATAPMTVSVAAFQAVTARTSASGAYLGPTLDAPTTVNIAAAPGANSRIDVVWVKQQDSDTNVPTPDGSTAPLVSVTTGTAAASPAKPPIPIGALELGTVTLSAGATSTNGAGVAIANTARQTVAAGGVVPVRSTSTDVPVYDGQTRYLAGTGMQLGVGGLWYTMATALSVADTTGSITAASGWAPFSTYYSPGWDLSADGKVTLRGMLQRTGTNVSLAIGTPQVIGTIPSSIMPSSTVSPLSWVTVGAPTATYPARIYIAGGSTNLQVTGMDSGAGTFYTTTGLVNLDGVSWYL